MVAAEHVREERKTQVWRGQSAASEPEAAVALAHFEAAAEPTHGLLAAAVSLRVPRSSIPASVSLWPSCPVHVTLSRFPILIGMPGTPDQGHPTSGWPHPNDILNALFPNQVLVLGLQPVGSGDRADHSSHLGACNPGKVPCTLWGLPPLSELWTSSTQGPEDFRTL